MFIRENTALVVVDVQTKLFNVMENRERLLTNLKILIKGMAILDIPIILNEQYPQGLGSTHPEIMELLGNVQSLPKQTFSCTNNPDFMTYLEKIDRTQLLVCGIEAHICVYQTAIGLKNLDYQVEVVTDAVDSRKGKNRELALTKMLHSGIGLTSTEMAIFELLKVARGERFKAINTLIK